MKKTKKVISKFIISFFASIILIFSVVPSAMAQTTTTPKSSTTGKQTQTTTNSTGVSPWYSQNPLQWYAKVYGGDQNEIFGERYTAAQVQWVFYGFISMLINGFINDQTKQCLIGLGGGGNVAPCASLKLTQFGVADSGKNKTLFAAIIEDREPSGITYLKNIGRKFNLIPSAKAQGFGYSGALGLGGNGNNTIQKAWAVVRDFSYGIFVIIMIAFAFMIMFRVKISPQVVITVQSALPKIAIAIVLVTFSYAIAGFLIDIMYVAIGLFSLIFSRFTIAGVSFALGNGSASANAIVGYFDLLTKGPVFLGINTGVFGLLVMYIVNYLIAAVDIVLAGLLGGIFKAAPGESVLALITLFLALIGLIIVIVVAIINFFKIIFLLGKTFLILILLTIFAPLQLTLSVIIPGIGIGSWIKSYVAKLATFVGVGIMFVFSLWILQFAVDSANNPSPTAFPQGWPPLLGGSPQMLGLGFLLASFAIFVMIPKVGDMIDGFISGKAFNFGSAIGPAIYGTPMAGLKLGGFALEAGAQATIIANALSQYRGAGGGLEGIKQVGSVAMKSGLKNLPRYSDSENA